MVELATGGVAVRRGMEASGHVRWFEGLLKELQFELWIGDAAEIQTKRVRKQTDRQDAQLILKLLLEDRFPRILDSECRESRPTTAAVGPAPYAASAHADHESTASSGTERRLAL